MRAATPTCERRITRKQKRISPQRLRSTRTISTLTRIVRLRGGRSAIKRAQQRTRKGVRDLSALNRQQLAQRLGRAANPHVKRPKQSVNRTDFVEAHLVDQLF